MMLKQSMPVLWRQMVKYLGHLSGWKTHRVEGV